jgi:phosphoribosylaminoimidazolecarboxamide formyltransferase/IMP cyclohydrolase
VDQQWSDQQPKNYQDVTVITSSDQYEELIEELKKNKGSTSLKFREKMSRIAFTETAYYDSVISEYFNKKNNVIFPKKKVFSQILLRHHVMVKIHINKVEFIQKITL